MQIELVSLNKRYLDILSLHLMMLHLLDTTGFSFKKNEKNEITRYKNRLVAQDFSQRPGVDYKNIYSPVMDAITFRYLVSLTTSRNLEMYLMHVLTTYLYGSLDNEIYMKIPQRFNILEALDSNYTDICKSNYNDHFTD